MTLGTFLIFMSGVMVHWFWVRFKTQIKNLLHRADKKLEQSIDKTPQE